MWYVARLGKTINKKQKMSLTSEAQVQLLKLIFEANCDEHLFDLSGQKLEYTDVFSSNYNALKMAAQDLAFLGYGSSPSMGSAGFIIVLNAKGWAKAKFLVS
jgi:hypothetical protein